ncbi:MAG: hypothetical protein JO020_06710, partial [Chloroflexi bacterium]|nr:hypothetical protein [Chloroflexota bacterium]
MSTLDHLRRLRQHFTQEQAEDILAVIETHSVTRDYLDSSLALTREHLDHRLGLTRAEFETRLEAMEKRLIMWGI